MGSGLGGGCGGAGAGEAAPPARSPGRRDGCPLSGGDYPATSAYRLLWAKAERNSGEIHRLIYHLIDVAQAALALWNLALTPSQRQQFAVWLGLAEKDAGLWLAFVTGLHDLGKASPAFQHKYAPILPALQAAGLNFPVQYTNSATPHGTISAWALESLLREELGLNKFSAKKLARVVGGHHGIWPTAFSLGPTQLTPQDTGDETWNQARRALFTDLQSVFLPFSGAALPTDQQQENALLTLFSGFVSVADWIGSMQEYFPFEEEQVELSEYTRRSAEQAQHALRSLGWVGWQASGTIQSFHQLFPFQANALQAAFVEQVEPLIPPALVILEAPTGIGKTEAALYLADRWMQMGRQRGLYIAMPTQATSNQMFGRVKDFLSGRYPQELLNLHLAHGQAAWQEQAREIELAEIGEEEGGRVAAMGWFLPRKRTLLAPFGVGTVDQALMSVLQTKHFFVRLFGLGHKTIIFDEVHAYDTYMSTLFQRLLAWLRQIGASVILLSATLPEKTRRELAQAYSGAGELPGAAYPRLTWVNEGQAQSIPLPPPPERRLALKWTEPEPEQIVERLRQELTEGGCAAVICNRVKRAQDIFEALQAADLAPEPEKNLLLFHSRFPSAWRAEIEKDVLERFGKNGQRPHKAILVATQVIEQSLDLDFDLLISDPAPVDLLIQRAGRLHRHAGRQRPATLQEPCVWIARPPVKNGLPDFGLDTYVYDEYVLLASHLALQGRDEISLPAESNALIEAVYGEGPVFEGLPDNVRTALEHSYREMQARRSNEQYQAKSRLVLLPKDEELLEQANLGLAEDDPQVHQAFQALTRLIEPGVTLVCLHQTPGGLALEADGEGAPLILDQLPTRQLAEQLLRRTVTVQNKSILNALLALPVPTAWEKRPALRACRPAIFTDGICRLEGTAYKLKLTHQLGLQIFKEVQ